jgi:hypothetical protein
MPAIAAELIPVTRIVVAPITEEERANNLAALMPLLDRYATDAERVPRPNLADISDTLIKAHAHATSPAGAARWALLAPELFDTRSIEALRVFGVAARAVAAALASNDDQESRAKLPVDLVQRATALKARVQRYLEYHLDDQPVAKRELDGIRVGTGYLDLESDLRRLAVLIANHTALVSGDRGFGATDAADCTRLADAIAAELSATPASPTPWVDRLWSAIRRVYADEVRPAAEWLFRRTSSDLVFYPSIYAGFGRPRGGTSTEPAPTDPSAAPTPSPTEPSPN